MRTMDEQVSYGSASDERALAFLAISFSVLAIADCRRRPFTAFWLIPPSNATRESVCG